MNPIARPTGLYTSKHSCPLMVDSIINNYWLNVLKLRSAKLYPISSRVGHLSAITMIVLKKKMSHRVFIMYHLCMQYIWRHLMKKNIALTSVALSGCIAPAQHVNELCSVHDVSAVSILRLREVGKVTGSEMRTYQLSMSDVSQSAYRGVSCVNNASRAG